MSCRRVRRELQDMARFGDLAPSAASPHLDHLETCRACRDEVGLDRVLVGQLRRALAARVEPFAPSARAWYAILQESQRPEPAAAVWAWSHAFLGRLRMATAMTGTGLALLVALNMEVVPAGAPLPANAERGAEDATLLQVPRLPVGRAAPVVRSNRGEEPGVRTVADPEQALMQAETRIVARPTGTDPAPVEDSQSGPVLRLEARPVRTPEHDPVGAPDDPGADAGELVELQPGTPS